MNTVKFLPQHRDKCYCRGKCNCEYEHFHRPSVAPIDSFPHSFIKSKRSDKSTHKKINESNAPGRKHSICDTERFVIEDPSQLTYTKRREVYETKYKPTSCTHSNRLPPSLTQVYLDDHSNVPVVIPSNFMPTINDEEVNEIADFRSENIDDCVGILNKKSFDKSRRKCFRPPEDSNQHMACSHRFVLNDRLLPIPTNMNENGQSICERCHKPNPKIGISSPFEIKSRFVTGDRQDYDRYKPSDEFAPVLIIEVQMDKRLGGRPIIDIRQSGNGHAKGKKYKTSKKELFRGIVPAKSAALRFQPRR